MNKKTASELIAAIEQMNAALGVMAATVESIQDMDERREFRKHVAELMGYVYAGLMVPVLRQYSELDPDSNPGPATA